MRVPRFFHSRRYLPILILVSLLLTALVSSAYASTYVGYGSANQGASTCGTNCAGNSNNANIAIGETIKAPFTGTLVSAGIFTGSVVPNQIVILTFPAGTTPGQTTYSCGSAGTCAFLNTGQTFTVQDVEAVTGFSGSTFSTVTLALPVSVTNGQWIAVMFMGSASSASYAMIVGASGQAATLDTQFTFGSTNPAISSTASSQGSPGAVIVGASFNPAGTTGGTTAVTQCYGNCGTPAVTLANTNSTHGFQFNRSITVFYQFQSNINGFILNATVSSAKNHQFQGLFIGIYIIPNCPNGQLPFTQACPGFLAQGGAVDGGLNIAKQQYSQVAGPGRIAVSNGQWVGIAVSSGFSGLDLNDTNTNVQLLQASGTMPASLSPNTPTTCACKMGLWAWVVGNVVTGTGIPPAVAGCQSYATIDCWLPALVNSFCSNPSTQCQTSSALFWIIILSVIFEATLAFGFNRVTPNVKFPIGESFIFILLMVTFIMTGLSLLILWVPIFLFMIGAIIFSKHTGRYF